jgi:alpha-L-fucosidase
MPLSLRLKYTSLISCGLSTFLGACGSQPASSAPEGEPNPIEMPEPSAVEAGADGSISTTAESGAVPAIDAGEVSAPKPLEDVQRAYVDLRFGMFLHFGILTYTGSWSQPNLDITQFNPTKLNPEQWADAAVSAHMKFGVLTTRHHDGFALWPSAAGTFNVGHVPWMNGKGDVVRAFVDAFRKKGLLPGLYYSVWDNTEGMGNGAVTPAQLAYVTQQITELLTNYGPISVLVFDGWSWKMGHNAASYEKIRQLVKSLQPNCLLTDHTHLSSPWEVDIVNFEEPTGTFAPVSNTYAATQEQKINASGGNDWFWAPSIGNLMSVSSIVDGHLKLLEPRFTNFLLNCPPNRGGLLDDTIVARLAEVGNAWSPNPSRPPLPSQGPQIDHPYTPVTATATSGTAMNAIDGINDTNRFTIWQTTGTLPQSITLDLGQSHPDVGMLAYVPRYVAGKGSTDGNITSYSISTSTDGATFAEAAHGAWPADGAMKVATFASTAARYVRLDVLEANGANAAVTEITVGAAP